MPDWKKKTLFIGGLVSFFVLSPLLVFFAQGNKIDISEQDLEATGGVYVKTDKFRAKVFVEGEKRGKSPRFISGLMPGTYNLFLKKEGYNRWGKSFCVEPYKVTIARNIKLTPAPPASLEKIASTSQKLSRLNSGKSPSSAAASTSRLRQYHNFVVIGQEGSLSVYRQDESQQATEKLLSELKDIKVSPDGSRLLFWHPQSGPGILWLTEFPWYGKEEGDIDYLSYNLPRDAVWYEDSSHILYKNNSNLIWVEVDDRGGCRQEMAQRNSFVLVEGIEDFSYDHKEERIFVKKGGDWYRYLFSLQN